MKKLIAFISLITLLTLSSCVVSGTVLTDGIYSTPARVQVIQPLPVYRPVYRPIGPVYYQPCYGPALRSGLGNVHFPTRPVYRPFRPTYRPVGRPVRPTYRPRPNISRRSAQPARSAQTRRTRRR